MTDSVVEELAKKRLGRTIKGKWRLDRLIGVGGMAAVYASTHRNGARVAIKMLHPTISASQQIRARFIREGYLANKVDHPGVVRVLDDDIDDSDQSAFLVMDLIIGSTLSDRAMERLLSDGEVLDVAEQVLSVLSSAHKQGIVHRDLKPDNLLVDNVGKVHVLDFGIARLLDDTGSISATKTGTAFGTPGFMAPEQALGRTHLISARTDIYALGATLFALVCGDFVHAAENPQELMVLVATQPARSLAELAPHMKKDVIALIDKATRNEPDKRWASAEAMLAEVRRVKTKLGLTSCPVLPLSPPKLTPEPPIAAAPRPKHPPPHVATLPPAAPINVASEPPPASSQEVDSSDLVSERPHPAAASASSSQPFGEPEGLGFSTASRGSSPPEGAALPHPSGLDFSSLPPPPRRPKFVPVLVVGGGALLLAIIAVVVSTSRTPRSAGASDQSTTATATAKPTTPTATIATTTTTTTTATSPEAMTASSAVPPTPTPPTVAATTKTTHAPATTYAPPTKLAPTTTASPKSTAKKPIDVGY